MELGEIRSGRDERVGRYHLAELGLRPEHHAHVETEVGCDPVDDRGSQRGVLLEAVVNTTLPLCM